MGQTGITQSTDALACLLTQDWARYRRLGSAIGSAEQVLAQGLAHDVVPMLEHGLRQGLQTGAIAPADPLATQLNQLLRPLRAQLPLVSMCQEWGVQCVLSRLAHLGQSAIFLKGVALAQWLYPLPHTRACADVDVWVASSASAQALARALEFEGFETLPTQPDWSMQVQSRKTVGEGVQVEVDIHWGLCNMPVMAKAFAFDEMLQRSQPCESLGRGARVLDLEAALLHACLHRASNLSIGVADKLKWLLDIHAMILKMPPAHWASWQQWVRTKGFCGVAADALRKSQDVFGSPLPAGLLESLEAASSRDVLRRQWLGSRWRVEWANLCSLPNAASRARRLRAMLLPSRAYMAYVYAAPGASAASLLLHRCLRALGLRR